jgi:hypothetical protein
MMARLKQGVSWAGLAAGAIAWVLSTQLNYVFATVDCASLAWLRGGTAIISVLLAAVGFGLSWRAWGGKRDALIDGIVDGHPRRMIAGISVLSAALFGITILAQAAAMLILGCEP